LSLVRWSLMQKRPAFLNILAKPATLSHLYQTASSRLSSQLTRSPFTHLSSSRLPNANTFFQHPRFLSDHHSHEEALPDERITISFIDQKGKRKTITDAKVGESVLQAALRSGVPIPSYCNGGGGSPDSLGEGPSCAFCHVYVQSEFLNSLPKSSCEEDNILLLSRFRAFNSRLCFQLILSSDMEGITFGLPEYPESDFN